MPYNSITRRDGRFASESRMVGVSRAAAMTNNPSVMHTSETAHWLNRNAVGSPEKTAWTINDKGNRVWFSYEHTPTLFPVTEFDFISLNCTKWTFWEKERRRKMEEIFKIFKSCKNCLYVMKNLVSNSKQLF